MMLTTETAIGQLVFASLSDAEAFVSGLVEMADDGETYEIQSYQGGRYHVARFYNGNFEAYC